MKVTHEYTWSEHGVVPPRCRKPRSITHADELTVEVPEVTAEQAPVGFRVLQGTAERRWIELRWWGGKLWTRYLPWSLQSEDSIAGSKHFPARVSRSHYSSREVAAETLEEWASSFLIVDDVVYSRVGEPRYYITTFGFGGNHGGTGLMVEYGYRSDVRMYRYFTAAQFEQAREAAIAVALGRGDTRDAERYAYATPQIEVLLPEAQTLVIPTTYTVTVQYTDHATLDVDADSEEEARAEAVRRIRDNDSNGFVKITHNPETVVAVEAAPKTDLTGDD